MTPRTSPDPPTSAIAADRLARLLDDAGARRGLGVTEPEAEPAGGPAPPVERVRAFGRRHPGVIGLVLGAGPPGAGWTLPRPRPVADAAPLVVAPVPTAASVGPSARGTPPPPAPPILVHVLGAVRRPGV